MIETLWIRFFIPILLFLILSPNVHTEHHNNQKIPNVAEILQVFDRAITKPSSIINAIHPFCFDSWIEHDPKVISGIKTYFHELLGPEIENEFHTGCQHIIVLTGNEFTMPPYTHNFPHFADVLFRFFSLLLWQQRLYPFHCLHKLMINETVALQGTWSFLGYDSSWIHHIVKKLNQEAGNNLIISDKTPKRIVEKALPIQLTKATDWNFLHPSDGVYLTNFLLERSPCSLVGSKDAILSKSLRVVVINRRERKILNINVVVDALQQFFKSNQLTSSSETYIKIIEFDDISFENQLKILSETDVLIGIHGSALADLVFMKPCSIVIEVYPWLFHGWFYFDHFAKRTNVLLFNWMESLSNTFHYFKDPHAPCIQVLLQYQKEYYELYPNQTKPSPSGRRARGGMRKTYAQLLHDYSLSNGTGGAIVSDFQNYGSLSMKCMSHANCNNCVRHPAGVVFTISELLQTLTKALKDRVECVGKHRLYANPEE